MRIHSLIAVRSQNTANAISTSFPNEEDRLADSSQFSEGEDCCLSGEENDAEECAAEDNFINLAPTENQSNQAQPNNPCAPPPIPPPPVAPNYTEDQIKKSVLRIVRDKVKFGWSRTECLSQLQNLYDLTEDERIPHSTWIKVVSFLKILGYKEARKHKICIARNHVKLIRDYSNCNQCGKEASKCKDY